MHVQTAGEGPALLLLHAFPLDGRMWRAQVAGLAADYRVLVPDMPGFGQSPRPEGTPALDDWAKSVLAACKSNGADRALVAGCSMGGYLAFALHRLAPSFAAGYALINTRAAADTQDAKRTRYEMVERARHEGTGFLQQTDPPLSPSTFEQHPEIVEFVKQMMADATPVGVMAAQRAMASRKDSQSLLESIHVPVTVVYGEDDPAIARPEIDRMTKGIPNATFVPVAGAGHLPPVEKPDAVTAALRDLAKASYARST